MIDIFGDVCLFESVLLLKHQTWHKNGINIILYKI